MQEGGDPIYHLHYNWAAKLYSNMHLAFAGSAAWLHLCTCILWFVWDIHHWVQTILWFDLKCICFPVVSSSHLFDPADLCNQSLHQAYDSRVSMRYWNSQVIICMVNHWIHAKMPGYGSSLRNVCCKGLSTPLVNYSITWLFVANLVVKFEQVFDTTGHNCSFIAQLWFSVDAAHVINSVQNFTWVVLSFCHAHWEFVITAHWSSLILQGTISASYPLHGTCRVLYHS